MICTEEVSTLIHIYVTVFNTMMIVGGLLGGWGGVGVGWGVGGGGGGGGVGGGGAGAGAAAWRIHETNMPVTPKQAIELSRKAYTITFSHNYNNVDNYGIGENLIGIDRFRYWVRLPNEVVLISETPPWTN